VAQIQVRALEKALASKGFKGRQGRRHTLYVLVVDGKTTQIRTFISHGADSHGPTLRSHVARELGLSTAKLDEFIECSLSGEGYLAELSRTSMI
jgi:hypothetical protein